MAEEQAAEENQEPSNMAEDDAAPADDGAAAADAGGDDGAADASKGDDGAADAGGDGGDAGGDDSKGGDDAGGDDGGDGGDALEVDPSKLDEAGRRYLIKISNKKGKWSRVKLFNICNKFEKAAAELLQYALENPMEEKQALGKRSDLLKNLYYLRFVCDVDDDFTLEEYESEMNRIKVFRSKITRLAAKEDVKKDSDEEDSSDDSEGDEDDLARLKEARKSMQYTFGDVSR